jgi:hypothetical protein
MMHFNYRNVKNIAIAGGAAISSVVIFSVIVEQDQLKQMDKRLQEIRAKVSHIDVPVVGAGGVSVREIGSCNEELSWNESSRVTGVVRKGDMLIVTMLANHACGSFKADAPIAELKGTSITLGWSWKRVGDGPAAACICTRRLEFRIPNVPSGEFTVTESKKG